MPDSDRRSTWADRKLVLESVGMANAAALRAIRQLVPSPMQEVAKLVYQAPSELARGLRPEAATQVAELLNGLGFRVGVVGADAPVTSGDGAFEVALVIEDVDRLPQVIREASAFLGVAPDVARRIVCGAPAVLVSQVSGATVAALCQRFAPLGASLDVSRLASARYDAVIASGSRSLQRSLAQIVQELAKGAEVRESDSGLTVSGLELEGARVLWDRLQRTGVRVSICNRDLERYDISLCNAPDSQPIRDLLEELGIPGRLVARVLSRLPIVLEQGVSRQRMEARLARLVSAGGEAVALPHSLQRFGLTISSVVEVGGAIGALVALGDVAEPEARAAVTEARGSRFGSFTKTAARWLQRVLQGQGARVSLELL